MTSLDKWRAEEVPWESVAHPPIVNFETDTEDILGFVLTHLKKLKFKKAEETLELWWDSDVIVIKGPKARKFLGHFSENSASFIRSDGVRITSVRHQTVEQMTAAEDADQDADI